MKKKDKKPPKEQTPAVAEPSNAVPLPIPDAPTSASLPDPLPKSRLRRLLPDILKVAVALLIISVALVILIKPPLLKSDFPLVTYIFNGNTYTNAILYRPLAMPSRYYVQLPETLAGRYRTFAVDRRREVAAVMTNELNQTLFGIPAIKRSDPLGMDLEFRHLDNSVWNVFFLPETILFSNAVLTVRLDIK